jgi:hypothetical protein
MRVPPDQVEIFLANGWRLGDEPGCGAVLMIPPAMPYHVNRVPFTPRGGNEKPRGDRRNRARGKAVQGDVRGMRTER